MGRRTSLRLICFLVVLVELKKASANSIDCSDYPLRESNGISVDATCHPDGTVEFQAFVPVQPQSGFLVAYNCTSPSLQQSGIAHQWSYNPHDVNPKGTFQIANWDYTDSVCYFDGCYDVNLPLWSTYSISRVACTVVTPTPTVGLMSSSSILTTSAADEIMATSGPQTSTMAVIAVTPTPTAGLPPSLAPEGRDGLVTSQQTVSATPVLTPSSSSVGDDEGHNALVLTVITPGVTSTLLVVLIMLIVLILIILLAFSKKRKKQMYYVQELEFPEEPVPTPVLIHVKEIDSRLKTFSKHGSQTTLVDQLFCEQTVESGEALEADHEAEDADDKSILMNSKCSAADLEQADSHSECSTTYPFSAPSMMDDSAGFASSTFTPLHTSSAQTSDQTSEYMTESVTGHSVARADMSLWTDTLFEDEDDDQLSFQDGEEVVQDSLPDQLQRQFPPPPFEPGMTDFRDFDETGLSSGDSGVSGTCRGADCSGGYVFMQSGVHREPFTPTKTSWQQLGTTPQEGVLSDDRLGMP